MDDIERIWQDKSDEDLLEAAAQLGDYTEEGQRVIRDELKRRGLEDPIEQAAAPDGEDEEAVEGPGEPRDLPACLRCQAQMRFIGTRRLLGEVGHLFDHSESFAVCVCPQCGHVELFIEDEGGRAEE